MRTPPRRTAGAAQHPGIMTPSCPSRAASMRPAPGGYHDDVSSSGVPCVRVGISGWTYAGWRGDFYPKGLPQKRELAYAAERMRRSRSTARSTRCSGPTSTPRWREQTPDDFVFAVKGGRFITHMKKLARRDRARQLLRLRRPRARRQARPAALAAPREPAVRRRAAGRASSRCCRGRRPQAAELAAHHDDKVPEDRALTETDADRPLRHALEFRQRDLRTDEAFVLLRGTTSAAWSPTPPAAGRRSDVVTSDFVYVRLHGDTELYASGYGDEALDLWAGEVPRWADRGQDVYVYFDNDAKGHAPHDARRLLGLLGYGSGERCPRRSLRACRSGMFAVPRAASAPSTSTGCRR